MLFRNRDRKHAEFGLPHPWHEGVTTEYYEPPDNALHRACLLRLNFGVVLTDGQEENIASNRSTF